MTRKFQNGEHVVIGGRAFGDDTKFCHVMGFREVGGHREYLIVKISANYTEWVPEAYVFEPNECLLDGEDEFKQHGIELKKLELETKNLHQKKGG